MLHTAAYWLMLTVRDAIPKPQRLAVAEFATLRTRLLTIAARITETTSRLRIAFAAAGKITRYHGDVAQAFEKIDGQWKLRLASWTCFRMGSSYSYPKCARNQSQAGPAD